MTAPPVADLTITGGLRAYAVMMRAISLVLLLGSLTACTTVRESFPGVASDQVWAALVAVARTPEYDDPDPGRRWFVKENEVFVDEAGSRIEIYRQLDRIRHAAATKPRREARTWRFQIVLDPGPPPTATFLSRGLAIPTDAQAEARRYFDDVRAVLSSGDPPAEDASRSSGDTAPDAAAPALEPGGVEPPQ